MNLNNKIIYVLEEAGFTVNEVEKQDDSFYVEVGQYTPLGEDWWEIIWFDGTDDGFINAVRTRYITFDVDEEAEIWIESRGKNGVPSSIMALVRDAEWKEDTLWELSLVLEGLEF